MLQTNAEEIKTGLTSSASPLVGSDFSQIPIHPPAVAAIQTKLTINEPGDIYEQEADRVSEQVMRMPEPHSATRSSVEAHHSNPLLQRKCAACEAGQADASPEEEEAVQRKEIVGDMPQVTAEVDGHINSMRGGGEPLPQSVRAFFEPRFNYDFGAVRMHTNSRAAASAQDYYARAFTIGRDIVFGAGEYRPNTLAGQQLLAHELAHVVQQSGTAQTSTTGVRVGQNVHEPFVQRACGPSQITSAIKSPGVPSCVGMSGDISDKTTRNVFRFRINCDEFASTAEESNFKSFLKAIRPGDFFKVHGFASAEGDMTFNLDLSCARGIKAAQMIMKAGAVVTDIISFGPTEGVAADRRSVVVTPTMIPGVDATKVCPKGIKPVNVSIFLLPGVIRNAAADLAFADRVFDDCCVRINSVNGGKLAVPGWANTTLHQINHCGGLSPEELEMFQQAQKSGGSGAAIWVFYVEKYDPDTVGSKGISCRTGNMSGKRSLFPQGAYIKKSADPSTLAHELGHILIQSGDHQGIVDPTDPENIMQIQDPRGQTVKFDSAQCNKIFANA